MFAVLVTLFYLIIYIKFDVCTANNWIYRLSDAGYSEQFITIYKYCSIAYCKTFPVFSAVWYIFLIRLLNKNIQKTDN